jgi:REP element-mobilizing transposase RayT
VGTPEKLRLRKKLRLDGYDYSQPGGYFITTNIIHPEIQLSTVIQGDLLLNPFGQIVKSCWLSLPRHYTNITLDEYCIMPNHFHGIITIHEQGSGGSSNLSRTDERQDALPDKGQSQQEKTRHYCNHSISEIIRAFKSFSAKRINRSLHIPGQRIWQRSFYDRIIRNEADLNRIRAYILDNPSQWEKGEDR